MIAVEVVEKESRQAKFVDMTDGMTLTAAHGTEGLGQCPHAVPRWNQLSAVITFLAGGMYFVCM